MSPGTKNARFYDLCIQKPFTNKERRMEATMRTFASGLAQKLELKRTKMTPIWSQRVPRVPQEPPKWSMRGFKKPQRVHKRTQKRPKGASEDGKGVNLSSYRKSQAIFLRFSRFSNKINWISLNKRRNYKQLIHGFVKRRVIGNIGNIH